MKNIRNCDICGATTNRLSDYFVMLCPECKSKYTDTTILRLIGRLYNRIDYLEGQLKENKSKSQNKNLPRN